MLSEIRQKMKNANMETVLLANNENLKAQLNVFYASNYQGSNGYCLIGQDYAYCITDFRYATVTKENVTNMEVIIRNGSITEEIQKLVDKHEIKTIYFDPMISFEEYDIYNQKVSVDFKSFKNLFNELRMVKSAKEIEVMKKSAQIADEAFAYLLTQLKVGMSEKEAAKILEDKMISLGADSLSFETICASGWRGALPHGVASDKKLSQGELVTFDFGCYYKGYASDMTRTIAIGKVSDELLNIYNVVLQAQLKGVESVKAGVSCKDVDKACRDYISDNGFGEYFKHGTGHGLGLDVHELPSVSSLSNHILEVGNAITIEPGIYIDGLGGVRIEDDVIVTEDGCLILNETTKELQTIEV